MLYHKTDWENMYSTNFTPWDAEKPEPYLVKTVEEGLIKPCHAIDLGCGTGNESVYLASQGFTVTGLDISETAIEKAKIKAKIAQVQADFVASDIVTMPLNNTYDFAFDRRCFHFLDQPERGRYVENLQTILKPNALFLLIVSSNYEGAGGLNRHHFSIGDLYSMFSPVFKFLKIELITLNTHKEKPQSYFCLMQKS